MGPPVRGGLDGRHARLVGRPDVYKRQIILSENYIIVGNKVIVKLIFNHILARINDTAIKFKAITSVSYTHLDVYKRQELELPVPLWPQAARDASISKDSSSAVNFFMFLPPYVKFLPMQSRF